MMLYVKQIGGKQYTVRDTGLKFTIFIDGKRTKTTFDSLKEAVEYLDVVTTEDKDVELAIRVLLPCLVIIGTIIAVCLR